MMEIAEAKATGPQRPKPSTLGIHDFSSVTEKVRLH